MSEKLYQERETMKQGQVYIDHVCAMTSEQLHSKSSIAAELAHRDIVIKKLSQKIDALENPEA